MIKIPKLDRSPMLKFKDYDLDIHRYLLFLQYVKGMSLDESLKVANEKMDEISILKGVDI